MIKEVRIFRGYSDSERFHRCPGVKPHQEESVFRKVNELSHPREEIPFFHWGQKTFVNRFLTPGGVGPDKLQNLNQSRRLSDVVGCEKEIPIDHEIILGKAKKKSRNGKVAILQWKEKRLLGNVEQGRKRKLLTQSFGIHLKNFGKVFGDDLAQ